MKKLTYVVSREAWYYSNGAAGADDVVVQSYTDDDFDWEFVVENVPGIGLRVKIFDDAWQAFVDFPEFFKTLSTYQVETFDDLREVLDGLGGWDVTQRTR